MVKTERTASTKAPTELGQAPENNVDVPEVKKVSPFTVWRQQPRSLLVALFASIAGFLFGVDIGYIGPIAEMKSFQCDINGCNELSSGGSGFMMGIFSIGCILTSLPFVSAWLMDGLGRRWTIIIGAFIFAIGAVIQSTAHSLVQMDIGRIVSGLSIGMLSTCVPVYQGEVAPQAVRGGLMALYQLGITFGILVSNGLDTGLHTVADGWRYSIYPQIPFALILFAGMFFMPESPRILVKKGKLELARSTLSTLRKGAPQDEIDVEFDEIVADVTTEERIGQATWGEMFCRGFMLRLILTGIVSQFLQQMCGMNAFMFYGPKLFKMAGMDAFTFQLIQGAVNFAMTIPSIYLVDKIGRTTLLKYGAIGMTVCMFALGAIGQAGVIIPADCPGSDDNTDCAHSPGHENGDVLKGVQVGIVLSGLLFVACFAVSWGPVIWAFCGEIFPLKYRSKGVGVTTTFNWVGNYCVGQITASLMDSIGFGTYFFYGGFCVLCIAFAFWIPETGGVPLEEMVPVWEKRFGKKFHKDDDVQAAAKGDELM